MIYCVFDNLVVTCFLGHPWVPLSITSWRWRVVYAEWRWQFGDWNSSMWLFTYRSELYQGQLL